MASKNVKINEMKKVDKEVSPDKVGKLETVAPDEVEGHAIVVRMGHCTVCGTVGAYNHDTVNPRAYQCPNCSVPFVF